MRNLRLAELLFNQPLMIAESKLNIILHALGPRFNLDLAGLPTQEAVGLSDQDRRRAGYQVVNNTAVIGIYGPLLHRLMASEYPSGGPTTYSDIRRILDTALADDGVQSIILDVDSPGGMVSGAFDLADHIYQSRSIKPITAVVNEGAFSSGYLLASSAGRIIVPRTGMVGSVGVIATHADFSRAEDAAGITVTHVYAGARKADGSPHMPLSEEAYAELQASVNETYQLFVDTVARNRGLSVEAVRGTEAGIYKSKNAISIGFADEIATFTAALSNTRPSGKSRIITASAEPIGKEMNTMTRNELQQQHPDLCQALIEEGKQMASADHAVALEEARQQGAAAELARIKAIEEACTIPGHEKLVASLKFDGKTTAAEAALQIIGAESQLRAGALSVIQAKGNEPVVAIDGSDAEVETVDPDAPVEDRAKAEWDKDKNIRAEFGNNINAYCAYKKSVESGRARILKK